MIEKCFKLYRKYEEIFVYLVVGVLTTIVSWGACFVVEFAGLDPAIGLHNAIINTIGWIAGVLFGYVTNRKFVFKSTNPKIIKEFTQFAGARVSTWILDIAIMWLTVNVITMDYWIAKIFISAPLVMIANYVFSKLFVFKKNT